MKMSIGASMSSVAYGCGLGSALLLTACGATPDDSEHGASSAPEAADIDTTHEAVVSGAANVSDGIMPNSDIQGETAAAANASYHLVAYNASDKLHKSTAGNFCAGYSEVGLSYLSSGSWRGMRIPAPSGIGFFGPDPGVSVIDSGSSSVFAVSSLAMSTTRFNGVHKETDTCVSGGNLKSAGFDRLCYTAVVVPKDGSAAFLFGTACIAPSVSSNEFDGTTVYLDSQNGSLNAYAASWNYTQRTVEAYKNGVALPNPFPYATIGNRKILGHPRFIQNAGNVPTLVAPDDTGHFWVARLNEANSTWALTALTSGLDWIYAWNRNATLLDGKSIADGMYSGDIYRTNIVDNLVFFYPTQMKLAQPNSRSYNVLKGVSCTFAGASVGSCGVVPNWTTVNGTNAVFPTVSVASVNGTAFYPDVMYWSENSRGTLTLAVGHINTSTQAFTTSATSISQVPCVDADGYWGDYDGMAVHNNGSSLPLLIRYFSDSTGGTCTSNGTPQHVSSFTTLP